MPISQITALTLYGTVLDLHSAIADLQRLTIVQFDQQRPWQARKSATDNIAALVKKAEQAREAARVALLEDPDYPTDKDGDPVEPPPFDL